jgi:hypothetical protein
LGGETIVNERTAPLTDSDAGTGSSSSTTQAQSTGATCSGGTFTKPDLSKLKACQSGGHCYAKEKIPSNTAGALAPCEDASQLCVPDEILNAGGQKLKQCTQPDAVASVAGKGGGCVNINLLPEVKRQAGQYLKQQECDANTICIPCKNPQNNTDSPFCSEIGVYESACTGGAPQTAAAATDAGPPPMPCCSSNGKSAGVCMSNTILPADQKGAMPQDVCSSADVCMPAAMLQGKGTSCDAGLLFGKGVCMDSCFNTMLKVAGVLHALPQDVCGDTEICTPCDILAKNMPPGIAIPGCQ